MTDKEIFCQDLLNHGQSASLVQVTGDTCPCMAFGHENEYSPEWHRNNGEADDCKGTGIINESLTTTSIKVFIFPVGAAVGTIQAPTEVLEAIGEVTKDDLLMYGTVNSSTGAFVDISGLSDWEDYIVYDSKYYSIESVYSLYASAEVGQWAILKRSVSGVLHTS